MKNIVSLSILFTFLLLSSSLFAVCSSVGFTNKPDNIYTDNGDGTISDKETGLMWKKCAEGRAGSYCGSGILQTFTWQEALAAANQDTSHEYFDWRLPNKNELFSLVANNCIFPTINTNVFHTKIPISIAMPRLGVDTINYFWTSTPYAKSNDSAWSINFRDGRVLNNNKSDNYKVRLVRDGL